MINLFVGLILGIVLAALVQRKRYRYFELLTTSICDFTAMVLLSDICYQVEATEIKDLLGEKSELEVDRTMPVIRSHIVKQAATASLNGSQGAVISIICELRRPASKLPKLLTQKLHKD